MHFLISLASLFFVSHLAQAANTSYTCFYHEFKLQIETQQVSFVDQINGDEASWEFVDINNADQMTKDYYLMRVQPLADKYNIKNFDAFFVDLENNNPTIFLINTDDPRYSAFFGLDASDREFEDELPCKK